MSSLKEALLRNGVFYFNNNGMNYTVEDGAGCYMIARDSSGIAKYRIEGSELTSKLIIRDIETGMVAFTINPSDIG